MKLFVRVFFTVLVCAALLAPQAAVFAQDSGPACTDQNPAACPQEPGPNSMDAQASTNLKLAYSKTLKGGYVAHGVSMRNTGYGTITVNDVPAGAKVAKAFLLWSLVGPAKMAGFYYNKGKINGSAITGSLVGTGSNPRWLVDGYGMPPIYAFRADVTSRMIKGGNGTYNLTGFASGITDGRDPFNGIFTAPLLDGATLFIIYSQTEGPLTTVKIYNGATTTGGGKPQNLHLAVTGINTGEISGLTKSTFIVAEGQDYIDDAGGLFFDTNMGVIWDGHSVLNGLGGIWDGGNFLDVHTVDLTYLVTPPENDFWFTVNSVQDGVTWIGQVVSYASGNQDSDGDKLKDAWELFGTSGDYLPGYGADPLHKDLFVEADYMTGHDHLIAYDYLRDIVNVFADAPINNPDGTTGINIHIDTGGAAYGQPAGTYAEFNLGGGNGVTEDTYLGTTNAYGEYDWTDFQAIKDDNFSYYRQGVFHYMIFAHNLASSMGGTSGISRNGWPDSTFAKGATDFIVSMGSWPSMGYQDEREGTFTHELGHNLGLRHGGNDHTNWKPNYLSVMNYYYQTWGVYRDGLWQYDYSRIAPSLNESSLNETTGLGAIAAGYGLRWYCPSLDDDWFSSVYAPVDWNCDRSTGGTVRADINGDGRFTALSTQNNWASITFAGGGGIGTLADYGTTGLSMNALMLTKPTGCLTYEDAAEFAEHRFFTDEP